MEYCTEFEALLDLYADGELSAEEMLRVQAHLDVCPACQAYVDDLLTLRAAFPAVEETAVPEGFAEAVMARVRESAVPLKKTAPRRQWKKLLMPLAACCAVAVLAIPLADMSGGGKSAAPKASPAAGIAVTEESASAAAEPAEAAPAEDAPAELMDSAVGQAEAPSMLYTALAPSQAAPEAECAAPRIASAQEDAVETASALVLAAEEAHMLPEDCEPAEQTSGRLVYYLSDEDFAALLAELEAAGIEPEILPAEGPFFTVTVLQ